MDTDTTKGMIKMYNAEVLSKFPVIQHFPFGSLFSWDRDPHATYTPPSAHTLSQPTKIDHGSAPVSSHASAVRDSLQERTAVPWLNSRMTPRVDALNDMSSTQVPWLAGRQATTTSSSSSLLSTSLASETLNRTLATGRQTSTSTQHGIPPDAGTQGISCTKAPWMKSDDRDVDLQSIPPSTKAPWTK